MFYSKYLQTLIINYAYIQANKIFHIKSKANII